MSKKLEKAVAQGSVIVRNTQPAQASLMVNGQPVLLHRNQKVDLTSMCSARDCLKIAGLKNLLRTGHLELL